jgi:Protein of unknown function (DUF1376)
MSEPLVAIDVDLRDFAFMPLDVVRLRDSDLAAIASGDAFRAAVMLWCASWHQVPAASLPNDDRMLARLAGYGRGELKAWMAVRNDALRNFILCDDGRLYHPVIAEKAMEAWGRKKAFKARTEAARLARLQKAAMAHDTPVTSSVTENVAIVVTASTGTGTGTGDRDNKKEKEDISSLRSDIGRDAPPKPKRKARLPDDCQLTEKHIDAAKDRGILRSQVFDEWEKFKNHHISRGTVMVDWWRAWLTWLGNFKKFNPQIKPPPNFATSGINGAMEFLSRVIDDEQRNSGKGFDGDFERLPIAEREGTGGFFEDGA